MKSCIINQNPHKYIKNITDTHLIYIFSDNQRYSFVHSDLRHSPSRKNRKFQLCTKLFHESTRFPKVILEEFLFRYWNLLKQTKRVSSIFPLRATFNSNRQSKYILGENLKIEVHLKFIVKKLLFLAINGCWKQLTMYSLRLRSLYVTWVPWIKSTHIGYLEQRRWQGTYPAGLYLLFVKFYESTLNNALYCLLKPYVFLFYHKFYLELHWLVHYNLCQTPM